MIGFVNCETVFRFVGFSGMLPESVSGLKADDMRMRMWVAAVALAFVASGLGVAVVPASGLVGDAYSTRIMGFGSRLAHYWRLGDSPSVGSAFSDEVVAGSGGWPAPRGLDRRGSGTSVGQAGQVSTDLAASIGSGQEHKFRAELNYGDRLMSTASVDVWVKPSSLPSSGHVGTIFDVDSPWLGGHPVGLQLYVLEDGSVLGAAGFGLGASTPLVAAGSQNPLVVGQWTHLIVTWDQLGALRLYLDGRQEAEVSGPAGALVWATGDQPIVSVG